MAGVVPVVRVIAAASRSAGAVGIAHDGHGYASTIEVDLRRGAAMDLPALARWTAADPARPCALQVRLSMWVPPVERGSAAHRRLHLAVRFEPAYAPEVVAAHGAGPRASHRAVVAAVDRLLERVRRAGLIARALDPASLAGLLACPLPERLYDLSSSTDDDLARVIGILGAARPDRSLVSVAVDVTRANRWCCRGVVGVGSDDHRRVEAIGASVLRDPAVGRVAPGTAVSRALPLGGGRVALAPVLTLPRR